MMIAQIIIAMIVTTMLTTAFVKKSLNQDALAKKTLSEITIITEAAQKYYIDNSAWPDEVNACASAFSTLSTASYLINVDITSPFSTDYIVSCTTTHFSIEIKTTQVYAGYIKYQGALPSIVKSAPDDDTSITTVPQPLTDAVHSQFLLKDGSEPMTGGLKMGGNAISNVSNVASSDGRTIVNILTIEPDEIVTKPTCPTDTTATLHISKVGVVLTSAEIPYHHPPYVASETTTSWTIGLDVYDENGSATWTTGTYIEVKTLCK